MSVVIVNFDVIYDIDLSIIKLIKNKYNNPDLIKQEILDHSINDIKMILESRQHINPLTVVLKDEVMKYADDYLFQFLNIEKDIIYTKDDDCLCEYVVAFIDMMMDSPYYSSLTVYCKNDHEAKLAKSIFSYCNILREPPVYNNYGNIFIKDSKELENIYNSLSEHSVVIIDAFYNMKEIKTKDGGALYDYKHKFMHTLDQIATIRKIRQHTYQIKEDSREDSVNENKQD